MSAVTLVAYLTHTSVPFQKETKLLNGAYIRDIIDSENI